MGETAYLFSAAVLGVIRLLKENLDGLSYCLFDLQGCDPFADARRTGIARFVLFDPPLRRLYNFTKARGKVF